MLRQAVHWSLHRPLLIAWSCVWLLALGGLYASSLRIDLLPQLAPAQATVQTEAPGLVAEQVRRTVTQPIESALLGTPGVAGIESRSMQGLSVITVRFSPDADPFRVRQAVEENLDRVDALPQGVSAPQISPLTAPGPDLITIGFTSDKLDPMALRDLVQWTVRPRLLSTPGVARVSVFGGQIRRIEVRARPGDLSDSDLGFLDILNAVRRATSIAGAGFIDTPNQRILIEPHGQAETTDQVGAGQIETPGADPVRIDDVADVVEGPAPAYGDALIMGKPGVLIVADRALGADTVQTTLALEKSLAALQPSLAAQQVTVRTDLNRPASFIVQSTRSALFDLALGVALVAAALALAMRDARVVLISLIGVPLTLLACLAALKAFGWTLNAMTLGALAVAMAIVIDDSVIDVESILGRLRRAGPRSPSVLEAILAASLEVRGPVVYATIALALSLAPLALAPGSARPLLAPLAVTIMIAAVVSLVVALAVTPALSALFLRQTQPGARRPATLRARAWLVSWLTRIGRRPRLVIILAALAAGAAVAALLLFRSELLPPIRDDHLVIETNAPADTSPDAVRAADQHIAADLIALGGVRAVSQRIGRDPSGDQGAGIEHSVIDLELAPGLDEAAQTRVAAEARDVLAHYPGLAPTIRPRFDSAGATGQGPTSLRVAVLGQDPDAVDRTADQAAAVLAAMPDHPAVQTETSETAPVVRIDINFDRLALFGLSAANVLDTVQAAFAGETVGRIYEGGRTEDIAVSAQADLRRDPETVGDLLLRSTSGISVPLKDVANVYLTDSRSTIIQENGFPRRLVEAAPSGAIDRFAKAAEAAVQQQVKPPPGVFFNFEVANSAAEAGRDLALAYALGLVVVFAFLTMAFDGRTAVLVLASTLFSFVGAAIAIALTGGVLSIGAIAGLVTLLGLSMRSAILLISRAEDLVLRRSAPWTLATVAQAAGDRLAPMAGSAALVILALTPFALHTGAAGHEILGPMAIVIIGGVLSGCAANLAVLPILTLAVWRPDPRRRGRPHTHGPTAH